ncbi:MAG TPA: ATP-binding protein [Chloroflexia bacterium]|nr:ATP-binding protein [Chloroflexia bacterium]
MGERSYPEQKRLERRVPEVVRRDLHSGYSKPVPDAALLGLEATIEVVGGAWQESAEFAGAIGRTTFDLPSSQDNLVTVVLAKEHVTQGTLGSQSIVRIRSGIHPSEPPALDPQPSVGSQQDQIQNPKSYLGVVVAGPFAEPDGLRGDAPVIITTAARGGMLTPPYHGRVQIEVLGEEIDGAGLMPPRFRPLPNSPVFLLSPEQTDEVMKVGGDLRVGLVVGHEKIVVGVPKADKSVLPRHTGIMGTTGSGKSTTVARLISEAQANGYAVIVLDVEGEYTQVSEPTADARMLSALQVRGLEARGVPNTVLYHLTGRDTANPDHPHKREFYLKFARLSPYTVKELLDLTEAQAMRFDQAYDVAKLVLRDLGIFPARNNPEQERIALDLDEFERGYPRLTLSYFLDIVEGFLHRVHRQQSKPNFYNEEFKLHSDEIMKRIQAVKTDSATSWRALYGKLWRLKRIGVFDSQGERARPVSYKDMLKPGRVSILDLSDTDSSTLNNLVIADLLMGVQDVQDELYEKAVRDESELPRVLIIIEEAHEFLSAERIEKMPVLFSQVARIAKRGRKRWLGLVFVTQLPQHLPAQVFGLINNYIIHKITDSSVISRLQKTVPGIDEGQWRRLAALAPGQAIVSFTHMARPLMVSIDPTPCRLRMVD